MSTKHSESHTAHLFRYPIASADMYYTEWGTRDVFLTMDDQGNFRIQGELVGGGASTAIELCQVFLEYAMNCSTWSNSDESLYYMQEFAQCMGRTAGEFLQDSSCIFQCANPTDLVLEHFFQMMNAHITIKYSGTVEHLTVLDCPLENTAACSGLRNIELAHYGINRMCQSMIQAINPQVTIKTSPTVHPEFIFSVLKPAFA